jgi:hypothetical protein
MNLDDFYPEKKITSNEKWIYLILIILLPVIIVILPFLLPIIVIFIPFLILYFLFFPVSN